MSHEPTPTRDDAAKPAGTGDAPPRSDSDQVSEQASAKEAPPAAVPKVHPNIHTDVQPPVDLESRIIDALRTVFDPEIPVNIYDLGLIYAIDLDEAARKATISMTLTSPACPVAGTLPGEVEMRVKELDELDDVLVELVWEPPWSKDLMSEDALILLGLV